MYTRIGRAVIAGRWLLIAAALGVVALGSTWGLGLFDKLTDGGYYPEDSPLSQDQEAVTDAFGSVDGDVVILYSDPDRTVDDPGFVADATAAVKDVRGLDGVDNIASYFDRGAENLVSADRHSTIAVVGLEGDDVEDRRDVYEAVEADLRSADGLDVRLGGESAVFADVNRQVQSDLVLGEAVSMPILLLITLFVFGAAVAAAMPLVIGGLSILGGLSIAHVIANFTDVSVFAANVITIIGLGMSVDYSLFVLKRFREELAGGAGKRDAILSTVSTAGRTVTVSGVVIILSMAGLLFIDVPYLHGIAFGVMSAVGVAMLGALLVLPAILYLLGPRVDKGRLRKVKAEAGSGFWSKVGGVVMKRPVPVLVAVLAAMAVLALPALGFKGGGVDERMLPADVESRQVTDTIAADFPGGGQESLKVMVDLPAEEAESFAAELSGVDGVTDVRSVATAETETLFEVVYDAEPFSEEARGIVRDIRALDTESAVTGMPAQLVDSFAAIEEGLPWAAGFIVLVTLVVLFLAFGSMLLPIKAVLMNFVSLAAAIGATLWMFQDGNLSGVLGFEASGYVDPSAILLMGVILFALSTDYEVFLLSRVREEWDRGADNRTAVLRGMQSTGSIITAAAAILIVVVGAFGLSGVLFMKMLGIGMAIGILLDATVVRMLLVPSTMRLLGRANWWVPRPLDRLYAKYQIKESEPEPDREPAGVR
ncbi:MMPL family transporter [Salininema proteolyticum]|uniref:MMPL family transporter n=1 Tax=Salininema proteolyticum TaxID=1607685 RepID=A0ABV8TV10_9ACTN